MLKPMGNESQTSLPPPEDSNPYAPPKTLVREAVAARVDMELFAPAGKGKRFLNYLIDHVGVIVFGLGVGAVIGFLEGLGWNTGVDLLAEDNRLTDWVLSAVLMLIYYPFFETLFGRTPGKWITGTKVVKPDGSKPGFGTILGRTLSRLVPFEPFSFLGSGDSGWHDQWSGTVTVDLRNPQQHRLSPALRKIYR
ncbi:RDD family protein [Brevifollis gellanilyticus]|uniref:RDD domain-containing protein n=1 Tax=Brevifollis gellanilyticus TaxID=748831 RepID=A0A512M432_9BACT|nr:RDD family protein [Brevifollis gellanilyticus]GEP41499.1 hypothetical protein BGE01nite_07900 [Brevifollis gellanilyticus]